MKVSWLGDLVSVFWCVELNLFSLESNEVSSSDFGVSIVWYGFGQSIFSDIQGYTAILLNYHGVSCTGTCWFLGGAWFQCTCGDFWVSSCLLMFPGVRSSLIF